MKTLPVWTSGLLLIILIGVHGLDDFPQNIVGAKMSNQVRLTCDTETIGAVTWKFNGNVLSNGRQEGLTLVLTGVDMDMVGEYSCWRGADNLSSTYLLLEDEEEEEEDLDSFITCRAKSYDCNFTCNWTQDGYAAVRLGLGSDCVEGRKSCQWFRRSDQHKGGFQFELHHSLSPFAEESTMLELTVEAIDDSSIFRRTKRFYLRDIVQPDSPQIVKYQEVEQDLNVVIDPPSSWSTPHSFFSLEHEIQYVLRDNGKTGNSSSTLIPKRISKLRVRSRDPLVPSTWSEWTPWKNVTY